MICIKSISYLHIHMYYIYLEQILNLERSTLYIFPMQLLLLEQAWVHNTFLVAKLTYNSNVRMFFCPFETFREIRDFLGFLDVRYFCTDSYDLLYNSFVCQSIVFRLCLEDSILDSTSKSMHKRGDMAKISKRPVSNGLSL